MRILFGVQGTGNGHLTRARLLVAALRQRGLHVDVLLSGRPSDRWPEEHWLSQARKFQGLTFVARNGRIDRWRTLKSLRPIRVWRELCDVSPERYDLVLTDYEPLCAWAAKRSNTPVIGIGHQYAFNYDVPRPHEDVIAAAVLKSFAPVKNSIALHWHPFGSPILPPLIDTELRRLDSSGHTLVYRPFEDTRATLALLKRHQNDRFVFFAPDAPALGEMHGNVWLRPVSTYDFRESFLTAERIICSAGFMLISEALHLGLPVMTSAVKGQYEQQANICALQRLDVAKICHSQIDDDELKQFLDDSPLSSAIRFPDVASAVATAIETVDISPENIRDGGSLMDVQSLSTSLWRKVHTRHPSWLPLSDEVKRRALTGEVSRIDCAA